MTRRNFAVPLPLKPVARCLLDAVLLDILARVKSVDDRHSGVGPLLTGEWAHCRSGSRQWPVRVRSDWILLTGRVCAPRFLLVVRPNARGVRVLTGEIPVCVVSPN